MARKAGTVAEAMLASAPEPTLNEAILAGTEPNNRRRAHAGSSSPPTAPGYGSATLYNNTPHGYGPVAGAPVHKKPRSLQPQASIDEKDNLKKAAVVGKTVLQAEDVKKDALPKLAAQHMHNFRAALGSECTRRLAPNCEVRVATGCTGSGGEVFTLLAILDAFRTLCPNLRFTYTHHCEKHATKRRFVQTLHKHLATRLGATTDNEPCFFDDITQIATGEYSCCTHTDMHKKKLVGRQCPIVKFDLYYASGSCKDLSSENSGRVKGSCYKLVGGKRQQTTGGSSETFWAITEIMAKFRPDMVFFENVQDIDRDTGGGSNLDELQKQWASLGYECQIIHSDTFQFGLPQHRRRILVVAMNTRDPRLFTFAERGVDKVFDTLRCLLRLCHRKCACATK